MFDAKPKHSTIAICVDDRECRSTLWPLLISAQDFRVSCKRLNIGDYVLAETWLFERKTVSDFITSLCDGRLFAQALRMQNTPYSPALIVEGAAQMLSDCGVRREAIQGALVTLTLLMQIPVLRSRSPEETLKLFRYTADKQQTWINGAVQRHGVRPRGKAALQNYILQRLPRVGPQRAADLLKHFGTVEAVLTASVDELELVTGIGTKTAGVIRWAVTEDRAEYF